MPNKATIDTDGVELLVRFSFNPTVASELKARIPGVYRRWDEEEKAWRVSKLYADTVFDLLDENYFATRDFTGGDKAAKLRQREHAFRRANRIRRTQEAEERTKERRRQRDEDKEARRETAEEARAREREEREDRYSDGIFLDDGPEEYTYWRARWTKAWPELHGADFKLWWDLFVKYGNNTMASKKFAEARKQNRYRNYGGRRYDSWNDGDFRTWYSQFFDGSSENIFDSGPKTLDPYTVLGIVRGCDKEEANRAYVTLARKYHPSAGNIEGAEPNEEKMKQVNVAKDDIWRERGW